MGNIKITSAPSINIIVDMVLSKFAPQGMYTPNSFEENSILWLGAQVFFSVLIFENWIVWGIV